MGNDRNTTQAAVAACRGWVVPGNLKPKNCEVSAEIFHSNSKPLFRLILMTVQKLHGFARAKPVIYLEFLRFWENPVRRAPFFRRLVSVDDAAGTRTN